MKARAACSETPARAWRTQTNVRILYDNRALSGYQADWGFACLIAGEQTVLFDTGAKPEVLRANVRTAELNPRDVDLVVISHDHWDHTGGLSYVLANNQRAHVCLLPSFGPTLRGRVPEGRMLEVRDPCELAPGVHSTGPVPGPVNEQALVVEREDGVMLITGCAHPGVDALLRRASEWGKVTWLLGGLHGFAALDLLADVRHLSPCHCTQRLAEIVGRFPHSHVEAVAGSVLEL